MGFSSAFICLPRVNNYSVQDTVKFSKSEKKPENKTLWSDIKSWRFSDIWLEFLVFWFVPIALICSLGTNEQGLAHFPPPAGILQNFLLSTWGNLPPAALPCPEQASPGQVSVRKSEICAVWDMNWPVHCWWCLFIVCSFACFLLSFHPALRIHNFTVLAPHTSAFVTTNGSAYSNSSAAVGEDLLDFCSAFLRRGWFL